MQYAPSSEWWCYGVDGSGTPYDFGVDCFAEELMKNFEGGAIGVFASSWANDADLDVFGNSILEAMYYHGHDRLGDMVLSARLDFIDQNDDGDVTDATDEILSPREKLAAVAYAHRSIYSETAGGGTVDVTPRLTGDGSPGDPLDIAQQGAAALDVLTWTGSAWQPAAPTGGGDNNYVNATAFNTTNGILTLFRSGLSALNQDLDGRYVENDANGAWVDSTTFIHPNLLQLLGWTTTQALAQADLTWGAAFQMLRDYEVGTPASEFTFVPGFTCYIWVHWN